MKVESNLLLRCKKGLLSKRSIRTLCRESALSTLFYVIRGLFTFHLFVLIKDWPIFVLWEKIFWVHIKSVDKILFLLNRKAFCRWLDKEWCSIYFGPESFAIILCRLVEISFINVFTLEVIVQHEPAELIVSPVFHKTD